MTDIITPRQAGRPANSRAILWKVLIIVGLTLGLLIPLAMIWGVILERKHNRDSVQREIAQTWAAEQTLTGPLLAVPYKRTVETVLDDNQKQMQTVRALAFLLPQQYQVAGQLNPETRYRGIYQSVVYHSELTAQGSFSPATTIAELNIPREDILWKEAFVVLGVPSMKGVSRKPAFSILGKPYELLPGVNGTSLNVNGALPEDSRNSLMSDSLSRTDGASSNNAGLYMPFPLTGSEKQLPFKLVLSLKGSQALSVVPVGKQNAITLTSSWESPSFFGSTLPGKREVSAKGFRANWEIPYFARSYGQALTDDDKSIVSRMSESAIGVQLLTPVDAYRQSERAIKYGVLFLVLTFATYFLFEIISHYKLHPFQYLLVGCAISLFYLLLIALSEVVPFAWAYTIASVAIIAAITLYSGAILGKVRRHAPRIIGGLLSLLYLYLYILLQLEDLSLLFGAIGLFVVLAVIMYVTRNIDWYSEQVAE